MPGKLPRESTRSIRESHYDTQKHLVRQDETPRLKRLDFQGPAVGVSGRLKRLDFHDNLGPYFHMVQLHYPGGEPAVLRQEDGSGYAHYPSGRKAIVIDSHQKNRRFSALIYDDKPNKPLLGTFNEWGIGVVEATRKPAQQVGQKPPRASYQVTESSVMITNDRGDSHRYPRTSMVRAIGNPRKQAVTPSAEPARLKLNEFLTIRFEMPKNLTIIEFAADKVRHSFALGEAATHLGSMEVLDPTALKAWTPDGILGNVQIKTKDKIESCRKSMLDTAKVLYEHRMDPFTTVKEQNLSLSAMNLPRSDGADLAMNTLKRSEHEPLSPKSRSAAGTRAATTATSFAFGDTAPTLAGTTTSQSATELSKSLKRGVPGGEAQQQRDAIREERAQKAMTSSLDVLYGAICDQPGDGWTLEKDLLSRVRLRNSSYSRRVKNQKSGGMQLWSGKVVWESDKKLRHPESGLMQWHEPVACPTKPGLPPMDGFDPVLRRIQCDELEEEVRSTKKLLVCVCAAQYCKQSAHALRVARAGYAQLQRKKANVRIIFCELAEHGAIHSQRRYVNPVVEKYKVSEAPWLLMFSGGECFYSKKFTGFVERLRDYPEITLPPILLVEPLMFDKYCGDGGRMVGSVKDMVDTERTLKLMHRVYDLATSVQEAKRMAINNNPCYGILMVSARVSGEDVEAITMQMRKRNPKHGVVVVVMHHPKRERAEPSLKKFAHAVQERERETIREMAEQRRRELGYEDDDEPQKKNDGSPKKPVDNVQFTGTRPIRKSFLDAALAEYECTYMKYDECGTNANPNSDSRVKNSQFYQVDGQPVAVHTNFVDLIEEALGLR
jgi:hypothetical protein